MPLLKSAHTTPMVKDAIVLDFGDLRGQADRLLDRAREEADAIRDEARTEAQKLIDEAAANGHAEGLERGLREGRTQGAHDGRAEALERTRAELDDLLESWRGALEGWERDRATMLLEAREEVLRFAVAFAEKIVCRTIEIDSTVVIDQVAAALALVVKPSSVTVAVHPDDRPLIADALGELQSRFDGCEHVTLLEQPAIDRGGCIVSTQGGSIDATIDRQIARMVETLLPVAGGGGQPEPTARRSESPEDPPRTGDGDQPESEAGA